MQGRCSLVLQTFLTNQDRPYTSVTEIAWNMQMSTNDNSINARFCWQTRIRSQRDFHTFCYTDGLLKKKSMLVNLFFRGKKFFPQFSIFISARILVSATNSRLWEQQLELLKHFIKLHSDQLTSVCENETKMLCFLQTLWPSAKVKFIESGIKW